MQRAGPFTNAVLAALKAARGFPLCPVGAKWQINFIKTGFARFNRQFIRLATRGRCLHLFDFTHYRHFLRRGTGMPRLMFLTRGAQAADFAMPESATSVTSCSASAGQFSTQAGPFSRPAQRSHLCAVAFTFPAATVSGRFASYQKDRPPRRIYSQYTFAD